MNPWIGYPATLVMGFILAYAFHGTWKTVIRRFKAKYVQPHLLEIKTRIGGLLASSETDVSRIREELRRICADIETRVKEMVG